VPVDALRRGDVVEVKSAAEILETLDAQGALDTLPFMPEMIAYCGRRFTVDRRAEKICDTIYHTGSRRPKDTVLLGDLRCDGSGHDGCQAECRLFWKEAWLRRVDPESSLRTTTSNDEANAALAALVARNAKQTNDIDNRAVQCYRCQATELVKASRHLRTWDPRPYVREYALGNVTLWRFLRVVARAAIQEPRRKLGLLLEPPVRGSRATSRQQLSLDLQPGEWVKVKSKEEIADTLNTEGRNRGLWFDREMLPYCERTFRVRQRVSRFINDRDGQMIELKSDCVTLEGVVCSGDYSLARWFCPRAIYPYWRECWLRRVSAPGPDVDTALSADASGRG
jgi:hypothetical protein